jgi:SIR2-like domain
MLLDHVVFVIGSGYSVSAGGPLTGDLTTWIVDGGGPIDRSAWPADRIEVIRRARDYLRTSGVEPTYEAIFTWLWTAFFASDPTMYRTAWSDSDPLRELNLDSATENGETAYLSLRLIEDGVCQALADRRLEPRSAPRLAIEAAADESRVKRLTLITVNHDRLLERLLDYSRFSFADGFASAPGGSATWTSANPDTRDWENRIQLIKLHGSIDWWSPRAWGDGTPVFRSDERPASPRCFRYPMILTGTGPKLFQASNLMFARQVLDAGRALADASCVVTVGYGFGDVRMNSIWHGAIAQATTDNRHIPTLVIDPNTTSLRDAVKAHKRVDPILKLLTNPAAVTYIEERATDVPWANCSAALEALIPTGFQG